MNMISIRSSGDVSEKRTFNYVWLGVGMSLLVWVVGWI